MDKVYRSGETYQAQGVKVRFRRSDLPEETRYLTFIYAPLYGDDGAITGIFCEGFDVTDFALGTEPQPCAGEAW